MSDKDPTSPLYWHIFWGTQEKEKGCGSGQLGRGEKGHLFAVPSSARWRESRKKEGGWEQYEANK